MAGSRPGHGGKQSAFQLMPRIGRTSQSFAKSILAH
jgi:hypothetical protein